MINREAMKDINSDRLLKDLKGDFMRLLCHCHRNLGARMFIDKIWEIIEKNIEAQLKENDNSPSQPRNDDGR